MPVSTPIQIARMLHRLTVAGAVAALCMLAASMFATIFLRSALATGSVLLQDVAAYAFAACVALGVPAAAGADRHVRVGAVQSAPGNSLWRATRPFAVILLLAPVFLLAAWYSLPDIVYGWRVGENSPQAGGLGAYWAVRALLPLSLVLTVIQIVARVREGSSQ